MRKAQYYFLLLAIGLLATFLRLYQLETYPQHFDQDESVIGYDAWSIWRTGADHHGILVPGHFRAFNEYLPGLAQYIDAPFVGFLGLNEFSTRLPFALMGIATVFLTASLGRAWFGEKVGLLAALLLATEPWHITFSRLALTNSIVPFFLVLALYLFTRAAKLIAAPDKPSRHDVLMWVALSALVFALLTRTYQPLKLEAPLIFVGCLLALFVYSPRRWPVLFLWIVLYGVFSSPQWIDQLAHWSLFQVQFAHNNILVSPNWPIHFMDNYRSQYDPVALFFSGFGGGESIHPEGIGQLFWLEALFCMTGLIGLIQYKRTQQDGFNVPFFIGWWFLVWPIAAALTVSGIPTETRTVDFLPLPELLAAYGAVVFFNWLNLLPQRVRVANTNTIAAGMVIIYVAFNLYFVTNFFAPPILEQSQPDLASAPYNVGLGPVLQTVSAQSTDCDAIWVEQGNQAYIYYLFLTQYPPEKFQKGQHFETPAPPDQFNYIPWFNNVRFVNRDALPNFDKFQYLTPALCPDSGPHNTFMVRREAYVSPDWTEIAASRTKDGSAVWVAYRNAEPAPMW